MHHTLFLESLEGVIYTKLRYVFETLELDDTFIAVPVGDEANEFDNVIRLNETAAYIFKLLQEETTEAQIIDSLSDEYDVPIEVAKHDVHMYLKDFKKRGVII